MKLKHLLVFEDLAAMSDPQYANPVFKIRYRSINNLSNKKAPDNIEKPVNDVLDGIEPGDSITGKGIKDGKEHTGTVVRVIKDEKGENVKIEIEDDGQVIFIAPSTAKFAERGDKGNKAGIKGEPADTGNIDYTFGGYDSFQPTTYESANQLHIKKFNEFNL